MRKRLFIGMLTVGLHLAGVVGSTQADVITSGSFSVGINTGGTFYDPISGIGFLRNSDDYDPIAPGSPRDSWGVAAGNTSGFVDPYYYGLSGNLSNTATYTASSATVTSFLAGAGANNLLKITQDFSFAANNVVKDTTTITNISGASQAVKFARDLDYDVAPTEYYEYSSSNPINARITGASYNGFESPDPLTPYFDPATAGSVYGPSDLGAGFQLDLGALAAGASTTFNWFYADSLLGQSTADLRSQLLGLGATTGLNLGSSSENGPFGTGADSVGFGVGFPSPSVAAPEPSSLTLLGLGLASLIGYTRRRRQCVPV